MRRHFALLITVLAALLLAAASAQAANRALLVGCDRFLTQADTSPASANNVVRMAEALSGGAMNLETLVTRRSGLSDGAELARLIGDAFGEAEEGDVSYFYISTHGLWEEGRSAGDFVLLLSDGRREYRLTAARLKELLDPVPGTKVLILDACHSGAVIGKGVHAPFDRLFEGEEWKVICSSGGAEESWFWAGAQDSADRAAGAGYFSGILIRGISAAGNYAADLNRDGAITLTEVHRFLRQNHGASTVQTWPEESAFPVLTYAPSAIAQKNRRALVDGVTFEQGALSIASPGFRFSFTVLTPLRMIYQLVYLTDGRWDFDHAEMIYDRTEDSLLLGSQPGALSPGFKERTITLHTLDEDYGDGYVLLQLLALAGDELSVAASTVLCIPPADGDPELSVEAPARFIAGGGRELTFTVGHRVPCELSVQVVDAEGKLVRRLSSRLPTRPEQLIPNATSFTWNGLRADGARAEPGTYALRISAMVSDQLWEIDDTPFVIIAAAKPAPPERAPRLPARMANPLCPLPNTVRRGGPALAVPRP